MNGKELPQTIRYIQGAAIPAPSRMKKHMQVWLPLFNRLVSLYMAPVTADRARFRVSYREEYPQRRIVLSITPYVTL